VLTPLVQKQIDDRAKTGGISVEDASIQLLSEKQPAQQFVSVEQIGDLALYLCSDAAKLITGISLPVDGGWTAQ
jgi:3-hydroxybutyrate dehydrogenase